jgi:hypothetical protein
MSTSKYTYCACAVNETWVEHLILFEHSESRVSRKKLQRMEQKNNERAAMKNQERTIGLRAQTKRMNDGYGLTTIVPDVILGTDGKAAFYGVANKDWKSCSTPDLGCSVVDMKFYSNHLKDPCYVDFQNDVVKGKMCEWRKQMIDFLQDLKEEPLLSEAAVRKQMSFAKYDVLLVLKSLNKLKSIPVKVMNDRAIMTYIRGAGDEEMSHFVQHMANCQKFILSVYRHEAERNVSVLTVFDDDVEEQYVYGKGKIENLSMLMKKSSALVKSHASNLEIIEIRSEDNDLNSKKPAATNENYEEETL